MKTFIAKFYQFMEFLSKISQPVLLSFVLGAIAATPLVHWPIVAGGTVGALAISKGGLDLWAKHTDVPNSQDPSFKRMLASIVGAGFSIIVAYVAKF